MIDLCGYTFIIDVDGTICPIRNENEKYEDLIPYPEVVKKIQEYHEKGAKIILNTSRNMNTFNCNIGLINKYTAPLLLEWLNKWNIPYDEIIFGKVWPGNKGFYIDDRSIRPDEFISYSIDELEKKCKKR